MYRNWKIEYDERQKQLCLFKILKNQSTATGSKQTENNSPRVNHLVDNSAVEINKNIDKALEQAVQIILDPLWNSDSELYQKLESAELDRRSRMLWEEIKIFYNSDLLTLDNAESIEIDIKNEIRTDAIYNTDKYQLFTDDNVLNDHQKNILFAKDKITLKMEGYWSNKKEMLGDGLPDHPRARCYSLMQLYEEKYDELNNKNLNRLARSKDL